MLKEIAYVISVLVDGQLVDGVKVAEETRTYILAQDSLIFEEVPSLSRT